MKKVISITLLFTTIGFSSPAYQGDIQFQQQDGSSFEGNLKGDEWFSWVEDKSKHIIKYNNQSKDYEYATITEVNGSFELLPSGTAVVTTNELNNSLVEIPSVNLNTLSSIWQRKRTEALYIGKKRDE